MIAKKTGLVIIFLLILASADFSLKIVGEDIKLGQKIYPNVYIDNLPVGGKTKQAVVDYFKLKNGELKKSAVSVLYEKAPIATFSGTQLKLNYNGQAIADRAYLIGRSTNLPSRIYQKMAAIMHWQRFDFPAKIEYDKAPVREFIDNSEEQYNRPAKNALFRFENGKVTSFRKEEKGTILLTDKFYDDFEKVIDDIKPQAIDKSVNLESKPIEPDITLTKSNDYGIEELIAEGKSDFSHSIPERIHNVILAASKFNGILIPKDNVFSFNDIVGDISSSTGYQPAYIIKEGKTVLGDGGGVCQVSTTLFRAALNAGLPIVQRFPHAYRVGYYENDSKPGFDATVFAPAVDLKIKNDTPGYLLIETEVDSQNNLLYFRLYGKKDTRRVEIGKPVLYDVASPPPDLYQDDPTLKKGVVKQTDFAAWGGKANFTYKVYKNDKLMIDTNFFSVYKPWQAVYLRGTAD